MWIYTTVGFYSVIAVERNPERLCVRARAREDLDALRDQYLPDLSNVVCTKTSDYEFRAYTGRAEFSEALVRIVQDVTYRNFKNEVAKEDHGRARIYGEVWYQTSNIGLPQFPFTEPRVGTYADVFDPVRHSEDFGQPLEASLSKDGADWFYDRYIKQGGR